ncbi:gliding motility lipoprotein GldH [Deminuibacter soli]|uniref:Gliding motility lipoprotein GldH n=1 Tax=Deminuibacter soli TaxID=2291815 RepID=A0A3E1NDL1_9BACT|nr:gliding motility lipoprotein GldH [Deminuibacter soli]RFM25931.1 gliding motility lipoprotein GldH [Deminuibacter soli]
MKKIILFALLAMALLQACKRIDVYEKLAFFPKHEWVNTHQPAFTFEITDTAHPYQLFFVMRHSDAYRYRNIWLNIQVKDPDSTYNFTREFKLADGEKWLGTGMDDIYEHRIPFANGAHLLKKGDYTFTLSQIMREDTLGNVLNAGIRVEKVAPQQ